MERSTPRSASDLQQVKTRLNEIVDAVSDPDMSLDDALSLYEEAVKLGMKASSCIESDMLASDQSAEAEQQQDA